MEQNDKKNFMRFMLLGRALVDMANENHLDGFKEVFERSGIYGDLMYWHVQKAFKEVIRQKHLQMIEYFVDTLEMSLNEDSFYGYLHPVIFRFSMDEKKGDQDEIEVNRLILQFLAKAAGKEGLD
jgi:hypothetical protein